MATPGAAGAGVERMCSAINALDGTNQALITELRSSLVMFKMIAEDLERDGNSEHVEELSQATAQVIALSDDVKHHSTALGSLREIYNTENELTDFKKLIEERIDQLREESPLQPENHPYYKQFKEAIWKVRHAGEPMPGQENEDLVMTCSQYNVVNTHCPLSGKPVIELDDPVRSSDCQHIYDRLTVMDYIKKEKGRRPCLCAAAGCPKPLIADRLICDPMLKIEIQELRMRGRVNTQVHEVADCTELDD